jgi:RNA polymerase sigma factor (sigma-70 family)
MKKNHDDERMSELCLRCQQALALTGRVPDREFEELARLCDPVTRWACRKWRGAGLMRRMNEEELSAEAVCVLFRDVVPNYDPARGGVRTMYAVCVEGRFDTLLLRYANRRLYERCVSIDAPRGSPGDDPTKTHFDLDLHVDALGEDSFGEWERRESRAKLRKALNDTLTPLEKGVLDRYLASKSYEDIALELRITPKIVDNALCRIKKKAGLIPEEFVESLIG